MPRSLATADAIGAPAMVSAGVWMASCTSRLNHSRPAVKNPSGTRYRSDMVSPHANRYVAKVQPVMLDRRIMLTQPFLPRLLT